MHVLQAYAWCAGVCAGGTAWLLLCAPVRRLRRISALNGTVDRPASRIGIASVLASLIAFVRNGGGLVEAFEEQAGRRFPTASISEYRVREVMESRRAGDETSDQALSVARSVTVACLVSERLGCEAARCLEVVAASHRRSQLVDELRAKALAVPRATMRLLASLPMITIALGELLGARPLSFLFGSAIGGVCLLGGLMCCLIGLLWMRRLLVRLEDRGTAPEVQADRQGNERR